MINVGKVKKNGKLKHTYATVFLLPTIGCCEKDFKNNLINVHIDKDLDNPKLYLIVDYDVQAKNILDMTINSGLYINHYADEVNGEIVIKFDIPEKYHDIFKYFIEGKYSKFNNEYKQILTNIYGNRVERSGKLVTVYDTLYPRKDKKLQIAKEYNVDLEHVPDEVFEKPDLNYEIYKPITELITSDLTLNEE